MLNVQPINENWSADMSVTALIVDDSATMLMSISGILAKAGLKVEQASSGEEALGKLQAGLKPKLMITDLNMGKMNGIELIRAARKTPGMMFTPILMLTTESQQDKRQEAKSAGATGWIVKPVDPASLTKLISQLVPGL
jgi:two-component system chemotaxis response regulator CheY